MKKVRRRFISFLVLVLILFATWGPTYLEKAQAMDEWQECTYCGNFYYPEVFCDICGGCNEDGIASCYEEHHHQCCGNCKEDVPEYCPECGDCSDCAGAMC